MIDSLNNLCDRWITKISPAEMADGSSNIYQPGVRMVTPCDVPFASICRWAFSSGCFFVSIRKDTSCPVDHINCPEERFLSFQEC